MEPPVAQDDQALARGIELLVKERLRAAPAKRTGLLLSGGLDSSLLGALLAHAGADVVAFTAGREGSQDLEAARTVADALGIELVPCFYDRGFVDGALQSLARELAFRGLHTLATGCLLEACLREVSRHRITELWAGNGLDLIFGGGITAEQFAARAGGEGWNFHDRFWEYTLPLVERWYGTPDPINVYGRLGAKHGVRFHLPFESLQAFELARSIDARSLFQGGMDKAPLRRLALDLGVPLVIAHRNKAMSQESSGMFELLRELACERVSELAADQLSGIYEPRADPHLALRCFLATLAADALANGAPPVKSDVVA